MKKLYFLFILLISFSSYGQNVTITKVIETGCSSPFVKTVELYVDGTVDFSTQVVLNYMQNGAAWADNQIDVTSLGSVTDSFVYIVRDIPLMEAEFPSTTFNATNTVVTGTATNGDDGYQVVLNGNVVSQFGKTETDADNDTDSNWNHNDAVATRKDGIPDLGVWDPSHWEITAENDLDDFTNCQDTADPKTKNLETYFATLGSTYSLGSGSGWTPTGNVCTTTLGSPEVMCTTSTSGAANDTYSASVSFSGGNTGTTFVVSASVGTVGGDTPGSTDSGTITISNIPEGTDVTLTVSDTANSGVCNLTETIESPSCIPLIINEVLFDPASDDDTTTLVEGDANGDGSRSSSEDEFIEFYNTSDSPLDISGFKVYDNSGFSSTTPRHVFPVSTIIPAKSFLVLFGGGTPTGSFGGALVQTASEDPDPSDDTVSPQLNLNNSGDIISVTSTTDDIALLYSSNSTAINHGSNQSVTRSPDLTGSFVLHTDGNTNLAFSPGLKVDGTTLSISQNEIENLGLYPNPVDVNSRFVNLTTSSNELVSVTIFDVIGKKVSTQTVRQNRLDISSLNRGLYLLKIVQGDALSTKKIIIK